MSRRRVLSREERALWFAVARDVAPLGDRGSPAEPPPEPAAQPPAPSAARRSPLAAPAQPPPRPLPPPIQPLEKRMLRALQRGRRVADAVIDLHGMRQEAAYAALRRFLADQQARGAGLVVVVTGKGAAEVADPGHGGAGERGVLRRQVPHWLRLPDLRATVVGFQPAGPRQGGDGALYVRLRRASRP